MNHPGWITTSLFVADMLIRLGLSARVIMRQLPVGVSLAWLSVILVFPFLGAVVYLFVGELRLGKRRMQRLAQMRTPFNAWLADLRERDPVDWNVLGEACEPLARLAESTVGITALPGNNLELLTSADTFFPSLIADIDAAERTCHLEFYIWSLGGMADDVAAALIRAAARGVVCRVLVDALGSSEFLESDQAQELRKSGVRVRSAIPGGLLQTLFSRQDLRLHRKIVVIDGQIAYTGSLNLVDPRFFKQSAGVGQWIDAMVRVRGPAVEPLAITFLTDWAVEAGEGADRLRETGDAHPLPSQGHATVQVVPSGPASHPQAIQQILLMAIYAARRELVLTTPYFVPDESLLSALVTAARRGVDVRLIVPADVDSFFVRLASQAHQSDLLDAGVQVLEFRQGLLHTKSVTVDGEFSLFGSLNLDPRSLHLNFEITLCVYDRRFTSILRELQQNYEAQSTRADASRLMNRSAGHRFAVNFGRLLSPLL